MSERLSFGRLTAGKGGGRGDGPFRILLMGDFSGRANRGTFEPDLASRRPEFLDVDNFEQVLAGLTAELRLPVGEEATATISVRLRELDDLHPDRLFESLEVFQVLRDLRSRLSDPATFDAAAAEVHSWAAKPGEPTWDSPWGPGRPGWHIECSAMSIALLGFGFDLHGGATELVFPHHEDEIAQSEGALGREPFVRYWPHMGWLTVNREKMSKSLGNFFTVREVLARYDADTIRMFLISVHYRSPLDFSDAALDEAAIAT